MEKSSRWKGEAYFFWRCYSTGCLEAKLSVQMIHELRRRQKKMAKKTRILTEVGFFVTKFRAKRCPYSAAQSIILRWLLIKLKNQLL